MKTIFALLLIVTQSVLAQIEANSLSENPVVYQGSILAPAPASTGTTIVVSSEGYWTTNVYMVQQSKGYVIRTNIVHYNSYGTPEPVRKHDLSKKQVDLAGTFAKTITMPIAIVLGDKQIIEGQGNGYPVMEPKEVKPTWKQRWQALKERHNEIEVHRTHSSSYYSGYYRIAQP